jgi:hypothetical protein
MPLRAAIALAALPRGNQEAAAAVVIRRGLTVPQSIWSPSCAHSPRPPALHGSLRKE